MAFLRVSLSADVEPELRGRGVRLRPPTTSDFAAWADLRSTSRDHLAPWEPQWASDELTRAAFRRRLRHYGRELREDLGYAFFIFGDTTDTLIGGLTVSNVRRGVAQAASMGYWIGAAHAGRGLMTDAVRTVLPFAFETLHLHRLEAACLPANGASIRVLEKSGFGHEGLARRYLKINGTWQDHALYARIAGETVREVAGR